MSTLKNAIPIMFPPLDERVKAHITISAECDLPYEQKLIFQRVIWAVAEQLDAEGLPFPQRMGISCVFPQKPEFTIRLDEEQLAVCIRLAVYPISTLAKYGASLAVYAIFAEEICHLLWDIADEVVVNSKVLEVLRHIFPDLELRDLYA
nr:MAG TPA: hypothetical protein [Caudoviricetes sp.]